MSAIWKYSFNFSDSQQSVFHFDMPAEAKIVHVEAQVFDNRLDPHIPTMWAIVDPSAKKEKRCFKVVATGDEFTLGLGDEYVGTVQFPNGLVWHILEIFE